MDICMLTVYNVYTHYTVYTLNYYILIFHLSGDSTKQALKVEKIPR